MKKLILALFVLHAFCATAWAMELKWDRYYVYCTASGRPEVGNGNQVSNYLRSFGNNPSVDLINLSRFQGQGQGRRLCPLPARQMPEEVMPSPVAARPHPPKTFGQRIP